MIVHTKGNDVEISPGVKFVERNHSVGPVFYEIALTEPTVKTTSVYGKECKQFKWFARNTETGEIIDYLITEGCEHYGPALFQSFEDSEEYWRPGKLRIKEKQ